MVEGLLMYKSTPMLREKTGRQLKYSLNLQVSEGFFSKPVLQHMFGLELTPYSNGPANSTITVQIPANAKCTGGTNGNACLLRVSNGGPGTGSVANGAGPFGGCVAIQQGTSLCFNRPTRRLLT
jgi:hypothetical protein